MSSSSNSSAAGHFPPVMDIPEDRWILLYYTPLLTLFEHSGTNTNNQEINVFGVIVSFSLPKPSKGSHRFSTSISIIDPSLERPSQSIILNWFSNDLHGLHLNYKVGDIIRCENVKVSRYNDFPQLSGSTHKSAVHVLRRKEDFLTGLDATRLHDISTATATAAGQQQQQPRRKENEFLHKEITSVESSGAAYRMIKKRGQFASNDLWQVSRIGHRAVPPVWLSKRGRAQLEEASKNLSAAVVQEAEDICPMLPVEITYLQVLLDWSRRLLWTTTLAEESMNHTPLHYLQQKLEALSNSTEYSRLQPSVSSNNNSSSFGSVKCDLVCLVVGKIATQQRTNNNSSSSSSSSSNNSSSGVLSSDTASLVIWDGTTNGLMQQHPPLVSNLAAIHQSLRSSAVFAPLKSADEYEQAVPQILEAFANHNSGSSSKNNSSSNNNNNNSNSSSGHDSTIPSRYMGCPVVIRADAVEFNHHLLRFEVGMWIRIRNLHLHQQAQNPFTSTATTTAVGGGGIAARALVKQDTQLCLLSPYMWDVKYITTNYYQRVGNYYLQQRSAQTAVAGTASSNSGVTAAAAVATNQSGQPSNQSDSTPLALAIAAPVPGRYLTRARICSWWPENVQSFVVEEEEDAVDQASNGDIAKPRTLLLSLLIEDAWIQTSIIFSRAAAEQLLGCSADAIADDPAAARLVEEKLKSCRDNRTELDFHFYLISNNGKYTGNELRIGKGNKRKKASFENGNGQVKRLIGFKARLPELSTATNAATRTAAI